MNSKLSNPCELWRRLRPALAGGSAALLLAGATFTSQAQNSPVGTWDILMTGVRQGNMYLTFTDDGGGTVTGGEIIVPQAPSAASFSGRNIGGDAGRGNTTTTPIGGGTNFYGFFPVNGQWGFDSRGRVVGYYDEVAAMSESPPVLFTNGVGFIGTVSLNGHITLITHTSLGTFNLRGVPAVTLPDISGSWYGIKRQQGITDVEFFDLSPSADFPNTYNVTGGGGPGYSFSGRAMLSAQKKLGIAFTEFVSTNYDSTRSVIGPFNPNTVSATMTGLDSPPGPSALTNRVTFHATRRTTVP